MHGKVNDMTYQTLLDFLRNLEKSAPDKLQDDVKVLVIGTTVSTIQYALWNDGSVEEMKPYQLFLSNA